MSGINQNGSLKKFPAPSPETPAAIAASSGDIATMSLPANTSALLEIDSYGNTPLIWASDQGQVHALNYILEHVPAKEKSNDAFINTLGYLGNTALTRAARGGHTSCVKMLLERSDINPDLCNEKMQYPLHFAAYKKHSETVRVMLDSGKCSTIVQDRKGRTPAEDTSVQQIKDMILEHREKTGM
jgi:ankyrin repeat protein